MNTHMYIKGQALLGAGAVFEVINPATLDIVSHVQGASPSQVDRAVAAALEAFQTWKHVTDSRIIDAFQAIAVDILKHKHDIARLICIEQGKPMALALLEVDLSIDFIQAVAALDIPIEHYNEDSGKKITVYNRPLGVVASITPWNWPFMIAVWHLFPAIKAKNCVVNKPSEYTPLSSIKLVEIINQHLPAGVCNLILGGSQVGNQLSAHPDVIKVSFTGSTRTGQQILQNSIDALKSVILELGGNDVAIVLEDVDIDRVAEKIFNVAFLNAGQTCTCIKRLYVHEDIYDAMIEKLTEYLNAQVIGNGLDHATTFGPVQNKMQFMKVNALIAEALASGATLIKSNQPLPKLGYFIAPALLIDVDESMAIVAEEQFGPVLPVLKFNDIDQVINTSNQVNYGLGSSIWTQDLAKAKQLAERMQTGTVWINSHTDLSPMAAFGGWKHSGLGYSFGINGLLQYTHKQALHVSPY